MLINTDKALDSKIKLEVTGTGYIIEDLDIDVEITANDSDEPNEAKVNIWNLSETSLQALKDKATGIRILLSTNESEFKQVFEGNLRSLIKQKKKTTKKPSKKKAKIRYNTPSITSVVSGADLQTTIVLNESYKDYMEAFISKSYKGNISSETVINDIVSSIGYPSIFIGQLKHKTYQNSKVLFGPARTILFDLLTEIGGFYVFQNGVLQIISKDAQRQNPVIVFDSDSIDKPEELDDKEIKFTTRLVPQLRPNDWCKVDTRYIVDVFRVSKIEHRFDNYGKNLESIITVSSLTEPQTQNTKTDLGNNINLDLTNLNTTVNGSAIADTANLLYGNITKSSSQCLAKVQDILEANSIFTSRTKYAKNFESVADISSSFNRVYSKLSQNQVDQITSAEDLYALPKGTIAVYENVPNGNIAGHVEIKYGQKSWISDHKYIDRRSYQGTYPKAVYIPKN